MRKRSRKKLRPIPDWHTQGKRRHGHKPFKMRYLGTRARLKRIWQREV